MLGVNRRDVTYRYHISTKAELKRGEIFNCYIFVQKENRGYA